MSNIVFVAARRAGADGACSSPEGFAAVRERYGSAAGLDRAADVSGPWLDFLVLWHDPPSRRWPSVSQGAGGVTLVTPYAPVGIEQILSDPWRPDAPQRLARALLDDPALIERLVPPLVTSPVVVEFPRHRAGSVV